MTPHQMTGGVMHSQILTRAIVCGFVNNWRDWSHHLHNFVCVQPEIWSPLMMKPTHWCFFAGTPRKQGIKANKNWYLPAFSTYFTHLLVESHFCMCSPIHDHPCQGCWLRVVAGSIYEKRYREDKETKALNLVSDSTVEAGSVAFMHGMSSEGLFGWFSLCCVRWPWLPCCRESKWRWNGLYVAPVRASLSPVSYLAANRGRRSLLVSARDLLLRKWGNCRSWAW